MVITSIVNGIETSEISVKDRALNYGDGIFETIAVFGHQLHFWKAHYNRLQKGCELLGIKTPSEKSLLTDIQKLSLNDGNSVVKIIVSRGQGGRGYLADSSVSPGIIITLNNWPSFVESYRQKGIHTRLCQHRLIINPVLAGIKHLNRLDQVIARNEWHNDQIQEGLMLDQHDCLVEGTATNLFMKFDKQWVTSAVADCAVAGITRQAVINYLNKNNIYITERKLKISELDSVTEMFVCNSVWGIVPVLSCDGYHFEVSDDVRQLQMEYEQEKEVVSYVV